MKRFFTLCPLLFLFLVFSSPTSTAQQVPSPESFLGYESGSKYTPHAEIVHYFEAVAKAAPSIMKFDRYGKTYEGRPLTYAILSSSENMNRLETIRNANNRLTGINGVVGTDQNIPAIVWLSYNVHGNEPSSSEVSMQMLYEIVSGRNAKLNDWLKNVVVIIDPCLNPDGRDRYVNWFQQTSGISPDANPDAREHREPWPGGRTNHYNFDLNRDWAWQTQTESQARLALYHQWMPHVHCDFHEQGINSPYYFAPAAEPMHDAITKTQKDIQELFGRNHAKYFDDNGWLYFTKQYFDLFYPSYGDTYPIFNGSAGMTYEQAGGPQGGVAAKIDGGDTLFLKDRIRHHFVVSLSTIETAARERQKIVAAFAQYFADNNAGKHTPAAQYVVSGANKGALVALMNLLDKNRIKYQVSQGTVAATGWNYFTNKTESFTVQPEDIVINAMQAKGSLLRVLFEKESKLSDSATYDITAWSLPYAYGLTTHLLSASQRIKIPEPDKIQVEPVVRDRAAYGYIFNNDNMRSAQFVNALIKRGITARFSETPVSVGKRQFPRGSVIVLKQADSGKSNFFFSTADSLNVELIPIASGMLASGYDLGSDKIKLFADKKVALLTGRETDANASGEIRYFFEREIQQPLTIFNTESFDVTDLKNYDVLILGSGRYDMLASATAASDIKTWVRGGGKLVLLEGAAKQAAGADFGFKVKKAAEPKEDSSTLYANVRSFANAERESVSSNIPGAIYRLRLDDTHPVGFGYPDFYYTLKQNDVLFEFLKEGWNIGTLQKDRQVAGFVGSKLNNYLRDGLLIGQVPMGSGSVIFFADDPIFRSFWEGGKKLFWNAVFL